MGLFERKKDSAQGSDTKRDRSESKKEDKRREPRGTSSTFTSPQSRSYLKKNVGAGYSNSYTPTFRKAGASIADKIADPGFYLAVAGFVTFWLEGYLNDPLLSLSLSSIFLFYTSIFIFDKKGLFATTALWILFVVLGAADIAAFITFAVPILGGVMVLHGGYRLISKTGSAGEGLSEAWALLPMALFFVDLGLVSYLADVWNIVLGQSSLNLLLYTPWWGLLGLFTTKKQNWFISLLKVLGVVYVFFMLSFGVVPQAYGDYTSTLPDAQQLIKEKQEFKAKYAATENPAVSKGICTIQLISDPDADLAECVGERQENSEINSLCEGSEEVQEGDITKEECVTGEKEKRKEQAVLVSGISDPTIKKPLRVDFEESDFFTKLVEKKKDQDLTAKYVILLEVQNPRKQEITAELSCTFERGSDRVKGIIEGGNGAAPNQFTTSLEKKDFTVGCTPPPQEGAKFEGKYKIEFEAVLKGLSSTSRLTRAFVGEKSDEELAELVPEIFKLHFPGGTHLSQAPADPAILHFAFGNPIESPIIGIESAFLAATIENNGKGSIAAVHSYMIDLPGFLIDSSDQSCISGSNIQIPETSVLKKNQYQLLRV